MSSSVLLVGLVLLGDRPAMPDAFWRLPADLREQATVVVSGRFRISRGPHQPLPGGRTRWALLQGFTPTVVYRGEVTTDYLRVERPRKAASGSGDTALVEGREYLLLLRPSEASTEALRSREGRRYLGDALPPEEVLAIVEP